MTMPIKFDTLEYTRNLVEAGIPAADAEAHANALSLAMSEATVSPSELLLLRTDILARIDMLRTSTDAKIEALRTHTDARLDALEAAVDAKIEALRTEMNAKFAAMDAKIEALRARFMPLYLMVGLSLVLHVVTLVKLFA